MKKLIAVLLCLVLAAASVLALAEDAGDKAYVVEKGKLLKLTGRYGFDDRDVEWFEVCYKGKKLWVSTNFLKVRSNGYTIRFYDKDGNRVYPTYE